MTTSPNPLQKRYEAIERVYSERQWDVVILLSEELLLELPGGKANLLRQRLQLLIGHTYLYGYQDSNTATGFYSRVRFATQEPLLRDIAEQGLEQCARQLAQPEAAPELAFPSDILPLEVVDEPELIELAQTNAASTEELVVSLSKGSLAKPAGVLSPEELAELSKGLLRVVVASARDGG
ncbi:MAG: hypothetical protein O2839_07560 [Cyanobacteria bacterium]|nr:hypothetical protein [Cyanobacteriota bacterium]MDA1246323.1 hypothetical protein [Cyanobacteriota bacterium]